eukprot:TRINITY_DN1326_c0_g1_i9.p2 TRINITY_DN1326_c0_g1~~TRINITY_DN1326_c0_g1_i9.p2  ORF type:complete len:354 (+),score=78.29 TRINITY_DN1326_c0_g1_i9:2109-3170(+)
MSSQPALQTSVTSQQMEQVPEVQNQPVPPSHTSSSSSSSSSHSKDERTHSHHGTPSAHTSVSSAGMVPPPGLPSAHGSVGSQPVTPAEQAIERIPSVHSMASQPALQTSVTSQVAEEQGVERVPSQPVLQTTEPADPLHVSVSSLPAVEVPSEAATVPATPHTPVRHDEYTSREELLVQGLEMRCESTVDAETERSTSFGTYGGSPARKPTDSAMPVFHLASMIMAAGGASGAPSLTCLLESAPTPTEVMQRRTAPNEKPAFKPLDLHLPEDLHRAVKATGANAYEFEAEGLRVLRLSSPRSKLKGLELLHSAGYKVDPNKKKGISVLLLASPRNSRSPGLEMLEEALAQRAV